MNFKYLKEALKIVKEKEAVDKSKSKLMKYEPDYAYLERMMQNVCDTMLPDDEALHLQITTPTGYKYDISKSKKQSKKEIINVDTEMDQWLVK